MFKRILSHLLVLTLILPVALAQANTGLPADVVAVMQKHKLSSEALGVFVQEVNADRPLLLHNPDTPFNPASVMKLVTTFAALDVLGPTYTWPTEVFSDGPIRDGVLRGNLYIKGYGNPWFQTEDLWKLARQLREKNILRIEGDLVLDNSFFQPTANDPAAFDGEPYRPYNALPDALLLNTRVTRFLIQPDEQRGQVNILTWPPVKDLQIDNTVTPTGAACGPANAMPDMRIRESAPTRRIEFTGPFSLKCGERELYRVVAEPAQQIYGAFRSLWEETGGQFNGGLRQESVPPGASRLLIFESETLAEVIRPLNKFSNNVMARQFLLTLGAEQYGAPGTEQKGEKAVQDWLAGYGLNFPELVLDNGSGLSREARISARHMGQLLMLAWKSPTMPEYIASLPIAGVDGTFRRRLRGEDLVGRAHLKTGTLNGARAMGGYVLSRSGKRYVVVTLHNQPGVQNGFGSAVQDALLKWIYER
ncbi:MAG: D-alanyl-D-alanine carboxypeptidase/D-alanyl-D-alanine-endopeptidase [Pseudomonadota bacterium]